MQSIEAISKVGKQMRLALWGLVGLTLICLIGFPSELGLDIDPINKGPWAFSLHAVSNMLITLSNEQSITDFQAPQAPIAIRLIIWGIFIATSFIMASLVWQIDRLFKSYSQGKVFTTQASNYFRKIGCSLLTLFVINTIANYFIENVILPYIMPPPPPMGEGLFFPPPPIDIFPPFPPMHQWMSMELISVDFPLLLAGLFMVMVAYVMQLGVQIQADVDATI
ncbi:DUF2975 domain-containing protein [Agarivorans sp.]|uniref:DUF2975 domain-containing protein n=1 Tax=Agarivorans sp. TaxID=1872412 RepID=UPI003D0786B0